MKLTITINAPKGINVGQLGLAIESIVDRVPVGDSLRDPIKTALMVDGQVIGSVTFAATPRLETE